MELQNNSGSLAETFELPKPGDLSVQGSERVIAVLAREVDELKKQLHEIKKEKILDELQLPPEILEQLGLPVSKPPERTRGRGFRPILSHEIEAAKKALTEKVGFFNEAMVARYLGVSYITYKKYARRLGLWEPKPNTRGKRSLHDPERGKYPLSEILEGKHPDYPVFRLKDKLIRSRIKLPKCELCGFSEKRVTDGKIPLILNFMDGDQRNHRLENMKLYCYNCTFTSGKGYIRAGSHYFDPDWLQNGDKEFAEEGVRF